MLQSIKVILNSITFKLIAGIYLVIIPLGLLLIYNNQQSRILLNNQLTDTHKNLLKSYQQQIDIQLNSTRTYLSNLALYENDPLLAVFSTEEATSEYAKIRIMRSLEERSLMSNLVDGYFTYLQAREGDIFLIATSSSSYGSDRTPIKKYVKDHASKLNHSNDSVKAVWQTHNMNGTNYLIFMINNGKEICTGAYINLSLLPSHLVGKNASSQFQSVPNDELLALQENLASNIRMITHSSDEAPVSLIEFMDKSEITNALPFMQKYAYLVTTLLILLIILLFLLVRHIVTAPLKHLTRAMSRIQGGDLDHRLQQSHASNEIQIVNHAFNQMIDQVQNLKINVYEESLKAQRSQLRNLQLQIRPHFLINSLNMIYNAVENDYKPLATKLILHSVDYFRYMVKVDDDFVPLNEELDHVRTYLEIQSIRYPQMFTYTIHTDQRVDDALVPPLLIQSFIENSIKYALLITSSIHISIVVTSYEIDFTPYVSLKISDTGSGYPDEILEVLKNNGRIIDKSGEHIGIRNAVRRMELLFHGEANWLFYNDNGAVTELTFPAKF
jgi:two-component system sensor histidine kinase YesM